MFGRGLRSPDRLFQFFPRAFEPIRPAEGRPVRTALDDREPDQRGRPGHLPERGVDRPAEADPALLVGGQGAADTGGHRATRSRFVYAVRIGNDRRDSNVIRRHPDRLFVGDDMRRGLL